MKIKEIPYEMSLGPFASLAFEELQSEYRRSSET